MPPHKDCLTYEATAILAKELDLDLVDMIGIIGVNRYTSALDDALAPAMIIERLREALNHAAHAFWPDDASIVDSRSADSTRIHGARPPALFQAA